MRYIDADLLRKNMAELQEHENKYLQTHEVFNTIWDAPTADAVEVVRCKDCRHGKMKNYAPPQAPWCCIISTQCHKGDFFCACGERRNNEQMCVLP